jgi:hypothetical protein
MIRERMNNKIVTVKLYEAKKKLNKYRYTCESIHDDTKPSSIWLVWIIQPNFFIFLWFFNSIWI